MRIKRSLMPILVSAMFLLSCSTQSRFEVEKAESNGYTYEYVKNDPLNARIYTLKNGLKVYLSAYNSEPRVQTQIAVKAGGKNDPADNTGLAHYLEHIMFKGTSAFGTMNWEKEKVFLDSIETMFESYANLRDSVARLNFYKQIDQVSNEASKLAIANEYDKMVSGIGARGTNAYTTEDRTVYINDIPANQLENWLQIESNRFRMIVPRLFHTELEAVYEEKNRSLDNDYWKTYETLYTTLFSKHPYGTQTVIGTIDHLKNPSITAIKKYFETYYRPNNVAICLSGDLDPDKTIAMIDKYFGDWQANENLPQWTKVEEPAISSPVAREVYGPDAEWVNLAFRFNGRSSEDYNMLVLVDRILSNSQAGLIDLNLKQQQKVLEPASFVQDMNDYSMHIFTARPREGQTLDQVRDLLLEQIELVKKGEFEDWLIDAVINDMKKSRIRQYEQNWARSNDFVMAFTNDIPWSAWVGQIESLRNYKKEDVMAFATKNYNNNYGIVFKRTGKDPNTVKVVKPAITKVTLNKEEKSPFHQQITANKVDRLKPLFLDYEKDIQRARMNKDVEVLMTPNKENDFFTLFYLTDVGSNNNPKLKYAVEYLQYLGTDDMTAEEVKKEFYKLGCSYGVFAAEERTYIYLDGLNENMDKGLALFEKLLASAKADDEALKKMIDGEFKKRDDNKKDKWMIMFSGLLNYGLYGPSSPFTNVLSNKELRELKSEELVSLVKDFTKTEHKVLYYGPRASADLVSTLNKLHVLPETLAPAPAAVKFAMVDAAKPNVYWTNYDMVQAEIMFLQKGNQFDATRMPISRMFNEYLGGNMSSPVFQELREANGLAYSAWTYYGSADDKKDNDLFYAYVGTQADKQVEAMNVMTGILKEFPRTENGFAVAKDAILNQIESERVTRLGILFSYEDARKRGLDYDVRKDIYEKVQTYTIEDVAKFHADYVQKGNFNVVLIGSKDKINLKDLQKYGAVRELTLDELFGYEKVVKINVERPL